MTTTISGTTGINKVQSGVVEQGDLAANVAGNGPAFSAFANANQNLAASNTLYKISFNAEAFDTNSNFDSSRFTPTVAGYYQISTMLAMTATSPSNSQAYLFKNGVAAKFLGVNGAGASIGGSALIYMNGVTDYLEIYGKVSGTGAWAVSAGAEVTWFSGFLVRAA